MRRYLLLPSLFFVIGLFFATPTLAATCSKFSVDSCEDIQPGSACPDNMNATCQTDMGYTDDRCYCDPTTPPTTPTPTVTTTPTSTPTNTPSPSTSGEPTPTPTPLPSFPTPTVGETQKTCKKIYKGAVYPPNGECYPTVGSVETEIDKYPLTCVSPPDVDYRETFVSADAPPKTVDVIITHQLQEAQLGGFGPSLKVLSSSTNMDNIAKTYLFNGLFDKPYFSLKATPREAWRTYWRYLTAIEQANIKADYIKKAGKSIENVFWYYVDKGGGQHETNAKKLKGELPGCLKSFPVCPTFYTEYLKLPEDVKNQYDTLLPFDFGNVRAFLVLSGQISRENISYFDAILSGAVGKLGLFPSYTPSAFIGSSPPYPKTSDEYSLDPKVLAKGNISDCPTPQKTSGVTAPKTYPNPNLMLQTVRVKLTATKIDTQAGSCSCDSPSCSSIPCGSYTSSYCSSAGCSWSGEISTYDLRGKAKGKPIGVLNNPKVNTITDAVLGNVGDKVPSFFKMMVPNFVKPPEKTIISAPGIKATTDNPNASVNGSTTIWRENNLAQDSMHLLQNCWVIPMSIQRSSKCSPPKNKISPFECPADCDPNIPSAGDAMALKSKFIDLATRWLNGAGHPAIEKYDTVVNSAVAAGVNPIFALTIWLNESNASNYSGICESLGGGDMSSGYCTHLLDFGINLDAIASNYAAGQFFFDEQLSHFLGLSGFYKSRCASEMAASSCPMRIWMSMFHSGTCTPTPQTDGYMNGIMTVFGWLAPNAKFPCYPTVYP